MIVVSDTSPLNYLVLIDAIDILPRLFQRVFIPATVSSELQHQRTPELVRAWAESPPSWLEVRSPLHSLTLPGLHRGESDAIVLAEEMGADRFLVDERDAAKIAIRRGLRVVGTLAVLGEAAERSLIDLSLMIRRLQATNFRGPESLIQELLLRYSSRGETNEQR